MAEVKIAKGQRVVQEQPLFTSPLRWTSYQKFEDSLASTIASLPRNKQETFFAIQNATPEHEYPLVARFRTNCLPIRDESEAAIFATACLINHSCQANLSGGWNPEAMAQTIHATRAIRAGEELTIDYVLAYTSDVRKEKLGRIFGFLCGCGLCSRSPSEIERNDAWRRRITTLLEGLEDMNLIMELPEQCMVECGQLLKLNVEEYTGCSEHICISVNIYDAAFRICETHLEVASAGALQQRGCDFRTLIEGSDSPIVKQMKRAVECKSQKQDHLADALRKRSKWYTKKGQEPKLLAIMERAAGGSFLR